MTISDEMTRALKLGISVHIRDAEPVGRWGRIKMRVLRKSPERRTVVLSKGDVTMEIGNLSDAPLFPSQMRAYVELFRIQLKRSA